MTSIFDLVATSPPYAIHDASASPFGPPATPSGTGLRERQSALSRLSGRGNSTYAATLLAAKATSSHALSRQHVDAILGDILSLVDTHRKHMSAIERATDIQPPCSLPPPTASQARDAQTVARENRRRTAH